MQQNCKQIQTEGWRKGDIGHGSKFERHWLKNLSIAW